MYCAAGFAGFLGLYTGPSDSTQVLAKTRTDTSKVLTYIDISSTFVGIPEDFAFYFISIANAGSGAGRLFAGLVGDKVGPLSVVAPLSLVAGALTFAWPFVTSKGGLIGVALVYGYLLSFLLIS